MGQKDNGIVMSGMDTSTRTGIDKRIESKRMLISSRGQGSQSPDAPLCAATRKTEKE